MWIPEIKPPGKESNDMQSHACSWFAALRMESHLLYHVEGSLGHLVVGFTVILWPYRHLHLTFNLCDCLPAVSDNRSVTRAVLAFLTSRAKLK